MTINQNTVWRLHDPTRFFEFDRKFSEEASALERSVGENLRKMEEEWNATVRSRYPGQYRKFAGVWNTNIQRWDVPGAWNIDTLNRLKIRGMDDPIPGVWTSDFPRSQHKTRRIHDSVLGIGGPEASSVCEESEVDIWEQRCREMLMIIYAKQ